MADNATDKAGIPVPGQTFASSREMKESGYEDWHAIPAEAAVKRLGSGDKGLTTPDAVRRLAEHGPNALPHAERPSLVRRFLAQFDNLLIYVLLGSAALTALLGDGVDTAVILLVVFINALVGLVQEGRAEKSLDAIRGMLMPRAAVVRDGRRTSIDVEAIVPGDLVLLEPGDRVPADLRLLRGRNVRVEEAVLTGESAPVQKMAAPVVADTALSDRSSMVFSGTLVVAGQGAGLAVATGSATELGRISSLIGGLQTPTTPLLRQMNALARRLTVAILAAGAVVFAFGVLVRGYSLADMLIAAIGVAVAAIPEGLPAVMTITLAIGVQRMAARRAIVRQLPAVETLGAVSVICSDKTGTFTRNEMTVHHVVAGGTLFEVPASATSPRGRSGWERWRSTPPATRRSRRWCARRFSATTLRCVRVIPAGWSRVTRWRAL